MPLPSENKEAALAASSLKLETTAAAADGDCLADPLINLSSATAVETNLDNGNSNAASPDFDPAKDLEWKNGVTTLPGSDLKFRYNEFGVMELITDGEVADHSCETKTIVTCAAPSIAEATGGLPVVKRVVTHIETKHLVSNGPTTKRSFLLAGLDNVRQGSAVPLLPKPFVKAEAVDIAMQPVTTPRSSLDISCCRVCGHHGRTSTFFKSSMFCSSECLNAYLDKNLVKKDRDRLNSRKSQLSSEDEEEDINKAAAVPIPPPRIERRGRPLGSKNVKKPKGLFSWQSYLEQCKSIGAPTKLFKDPFPCIKNGFRTGMKLEAIDPVHQSMFCVMTVAETRGFRIRLHFDGFSDCHDFWVNADSTDIFPAGWCEKTGHKLQPPKGFTRQNFNWPSYLKLSKAQLAPKHLFTNRSPNSVTPHGFRFGMKLEAVDKKTIVDNQNSTLVCVATITDVMDNRILVHFDGWDTIYDYWSDPTSPYIHPVGWCQENGHVLTPPNNCKDPEKFTWEAYLAKTKTQAAPARAFKQRPANGFRKGMKLETVDIRNPSLIRVATVVDVRSHQIKLHFDNWSDVYDFWVDDDSPDIHPLQWCDKTGHPLEPPPTKDAFGNYSGQGSCPTPGCQGIGHIRGPKYTTHHSAFGCPYSQGNLSKDLGIPDRMQVSGKETSADTKKIMVIPEQLLPRCPVAMRSQLKEENGEDEEDLDPVSSSQTVKSSVGRGRRKHKIASDDGYPVKEARLSRDASSDSSSSIKCDSRSSTNSSMVSSVAPSSEKSTSLPITAIPPTLMVSRPVPAASITSELSTSIHRSVFMPPPFAGNQVCHGDLPTFHRHLKLLPGLGRFKDSEIRCWTIEQVSDFVRSLPGCQDVAKAFKDEQIDGEAFLLLTQMDIVKLMNIKLGPALKIYSSIAMFHDMRGS